MLHVAERKLDSFLCCTQPYMMRKRTTDACLPLWRPFLGLLSQLDVSCTGLGRSQKGGPVPGYILLLACP